MASGSAFRPPAFAPLHSRHVHLDRHLQPNEVVTLLRDNSSFSPYATSSRVIGSFMRQTTVGAEPAARAHKPSPFSHPPQPNLTSMSDSLGPVDLDIERMLHQKVSLVSPRAAEANAPRAAGSSSNPRLEPKVPLRARPRANMMMRCANEPQTSVVMSELIDV
eukprot:2702877-Prymnesium_polylepis.1